MKADIFQAKLSLRKNWIVTPNKQTTNPNKQTNKNKKFSQK